MLPLLLPLARERSAAAALGEAPPLTRLARLVASLSLFLSLFLFLCVSRAQLPPDGFHLGRSAAASRRAETANKQSIERNELKRDETCASSR